MITALRWLLPLVVVVCVDVTAESRFRVRLAWDIAHLSSGEMTLGNTDQTHRQNYNADFRYMFERKSPVWSLDFHGVGITTVSSIDKSASSFSALGTNANLPQRYWNLSKQLDSGAHHTISVSIDQLRLTYKKDRWRLMVGRLPVFWGRGIVYQPLDVFNAHPPTAIDREFKRGNDSVVLERLFDNGVELQMLGILRDLGNESISKSSTQALKTYFPLGENELELIVGRHNNESIVGTSLTLPIGGLVLRTDIGATCNDAYSCQKSGIINVDYSFGVRGGLIYTFAEYYLNGFGVSSLREGLRNLPARLSTGIQRGEIFAYGRHQLAVGSSITWHPLWNQSLSLLANLSDHSVLLQTYANYLPTDDLSVSFGIRVPFANDNEEFGPLSLDDSTSIGGQAGLFFELSYYR